MGSNSASNGDTADFTRTRTTATKKEKRPSSCKSVEGIGFRYRQNV